MRWDVSGHTVVVLWGGTGVIIVIVVGNGHGDLSSSNLWKGRLHILPLPGIDKKGFTELSNP